jgi:hypothetical protein
MSSSWVPLRPTYHLRVFAVCLVLVVLCLAVLLFGVEMEAVAPATGIVTARDLHEVRALLAGLAEPGWYEGEVLRPGPAPLVARMDAQGNGRVQPAAESAAVLHFEWRDQGQVFKVQNVRFHRLQPGDELWPRQVLASVQADEICFRLTRLEDQLKEKESRGDGTEQLVQERDRLRYQLDQALLRVPETGDLWLTLETRVAPRQAIAAGDVLAVIVPADPQTRQPLDLVARLSVDEKHWGQLAPGQHVRLKSGVHSHRLHGHAEARIDRLEPAGQAGTDNERRFQALAPLTSAPFTMPIGSSFQAEVIVGRKPVYRIILEH